MSITPLISFRGVNLPKYCTVMFCRPIELIEYFNAVTNKTSVRCYSALQSVLLPKGRMEGWLLIRVRAFRWDWNFTVLLRGWTETVTLLHDLFLKSRHISALHFQCWLFFFFIVYERSIWYFIPTDMLNKNRYRNFAYAYVQWHMQSVSILHSIFRFFYHLVCCDLIFMREGGFIFLLL